MQYILTQEEYDSLRETKRAIESADRDKLQALCTKIADEMPVPHTDLWGKVYRTEPWGCILTSEHEHCCDECPVENICPYNRKEFSQ